MSYPCGAADFVSQFAGKLSDAGHDVTVVTSNAAVEPGSWKFHVEKIPGAWNLAHLVRIARYLRGGNFELVDFQYEAAMYGGGGQCLLLPGLLLGRDFGLALTLHSADLPARGGRLWRLAQVLQFDGVVFYSETLRARLAQRFPAHASRFLLQGFPANIARAVPPELQPMIGKIKAGYFESPSLLVYFGHISPDRGIEDMLAALARLRERGLTPRLVLMSQFSPADNVYHQNLLARVKGAGLEKQVIFTGRLSESEVSRFLSAADATVLPFPGGVTFKNGSFAASIEHGVPAITTVSAETEAEIRDSGALLAYPAGDVEQLAESIARLVSESALRGRLAAGASALRDRLSWNTYISSRTNFYEKLLGFGRKGNRRATRSTKPTAD